MNNSRSDDPDHFFGSTEGDDDDDDESTTSKKRTREEKEADDKKNRGNYRCSKCNLPKKGHVCPYQPRFRRRDQQLDGAAHDVEIQCEMDMDMTVRMLPLERQGLPESYMAVNTALLQQQYNMQVAAAGYVAGESIHSAARNDLTTSINKIDEGGKVDSL